MQFVNEWKTKFSSVVIFDRFILYDDLILTMREILVFAGIFALALSMMMIPSLQASAVTDPYSYGRTHVGSRFDATAICGDHYCTLSEHAQWAKAVLSSQRMSQGKINAGQHGENVMNGVTGQAQNSSTMHGSGRTGYPTK